MENCKKFEVYLLDAQKVSLRDLPEDLAEHLQACSACQAEMRKMQAFSASIQPVISQQSLSKNRSDVLSLIAKQTIVSEPAYAHKSNDSWFSFFLSFRLAFCVAIIIASVLAAFYLFQNPSMPTVEGFRLEVVKGDVLINEKTLSDNVATVFPGDSIGGHSELRAKIFYCATASVEITGTATLRLTSKGFEPLNGLFSADFEGANFGFKVETKAVDFIITGTRILFACSQNMIKARLISGKVKLIDKKSNRETLWLPAQQDVVISGDSVEFVAVPLPASEPPEKIGPDDKRQIEYDTPPSMPDADNEAGTTEFAAPDTFNSSEAESIDTTGEQIPFEDPESTQQDYGAQSSIDNESQQPEAIKIRIPGNFLRR